jgi:predicted acetyltransferase
MLEMRTVNPDEFFQWVWAEARAYGNRLNIDPEILRPHFDLDRSIAVFDQGNVVGGAHSHKLEMAVPGSLAVVAGVANIAVQPTHTRQGILTRMMHHQINGIHERGEPLAALFASESVIYGRYGYGMSSFREQWTIERQHNRYARPYDTPGRMVFVDPANITNDLPEVFRRSTKDRPGVFQKSGYLWEREKQAPEHRQGGQGGLFYIAYEDSGRIDGYARYRTSGNTLTVNELMATTPEANSALWRFCFDLDLVTRTEAERRPVDDPMLWMLADPRQLQRITRDGLWLRLVDVAESLELRSYMESGRLVLEVRDDLCSWNQGCFELEASPEGATCRPSTASPDLTVTVAGLASAYLGAASLTKLFQAGLVEERASGALLRADRLFATRLAPWTPCGF